MRKVKAPAVLRRCMIEVVGELCVRRSVTGSCSGMECHRC